MDDNRWEQCEEIQVEGNCGRWIFKDEMSGNCESWSQDVGPQKRDDKGAQCIAR